MYIFNSWTNFSMGQIMNYYIPVQLIKKEILYRQNNFADSFYIIQEGTFDAYVELSLSEFSKYKNYILKNNKNILDWIREEKEKNKIVLLIQNHYCLNLLALYAIFQALHLVR